ncbi:MAG: hypothetical protein IJX81_01580 [Clostridia bacterium]|nr:hypothetical protein [Clostridia bacterium]
MKLKKWLIALLCAALAFSAFAFSACTKDEGKSSGGSYGTGGGEENDGWTDNY